MATKNNPGAFDCYAKAHPDEPLFVLLGRDMHAPTLVWLWASLRELDGEDSTKVTEARDCVVDMLEWQLHHGRTTVGVGHAALAGLLELIRMANHAIKVAGHVHNAPTADEEVRRFLAATLFEMSARTDVQTGGLKAAPQPTPAPPPAAAAFGGTD